MKKNILLTALLLNLGVATNASAAVFSYDINNPTGVGNEAGVITSFQTSYDNNSETLNWKSTLAESNGNIANAFWLVVSDGPDPMIGRNEYAIFYGDSFSGNLTSYVYNGLNNGQSWNAPGEFVQTFDGAFKTETLANGGASFSFSVDVSNVNDYTPTTLGINAWDGAQYGEQIGVWYHPVILDRASTYNADGSLATFPELVSGFFDANDQITTDVPEPGTFALTSLALIGVLFGRRRRLE